MATLQELLEVTDESTSREVVAGGIRIHYNEVGEGDPIICIHGGGPGATAWSNFRGNVQDLALNNRMIMFDMPGWGRSDYPEEALSQEWIGWIGKVINDFMEALNIESADIIGNSMGGQAGLGLAVHYPHRVKHLVMIGSQPTNVVFFQPTPQEALDNIVKFYAGEGPTIEKMDRLAKSLVYDSSRLTPDVIQERFDVATQPLALEQAKMRARQHRIDYYPYLEQNAAPTLLVWGQEDKGGALEVGLLMLKRFQNARLYVISKCGHWAQVEYREEFDRVCLDFFKT
ncbi:MAG: alpha/beta hydrolase [Chloroflexota bacterium]|nr:alpha/beta hydrolase [Chloroflexota bacterium]